MAKKKIIGVTEPSMFTENCIETIETRFNANPLKLCQNQQDDIEHWIDQCDAIILAGGCDIHPRMYGLPVLNEHGFTHFDMARDVRELLIIKHCFKTDKPILGICRGHQMMGIYHGLPMIPDLGDGLICHQPTRQQIKATQTDPMHRVTLLRSAEPEYHVVDPIMIIQDNVNPSKTLWVNSFHHQAIKFEPKEKKIGVKTLGIAEGSEKKETIIELMRGTKRRWLSCQWHPEFDWQKNYASKMVLDNFEVLFTTPPRPKNG